MVQLVFDIITGSMLRMNEFVSIFALFNSSLHHLGEGGGWTTRQLPARSTVGRASGTILAPNVRNYQHTLTVVV